MDIALEEAGKLGASGAEVFYERGSELTARVFDHAVEKFSSAESRGLGIRFYMGHRLGRSYTSDLSGTAVREAVRRASESAAVSPEDPDRDLPDEGLFPEGARSGEMLGDELELWNPDVEGTSPSRKIEFALGMEKGALRFDDRIAGVETATYGEAVGEVALASTEGFRASYRSSVCYGYVIAIGRDESGSQTGFGFTADRSFGSLDADAAGEEAAGMAVSLLGGRQVETASVPVLFDNLTCAELLAAIAFALSGEAVAKGKSFLAGRLGEPVAAQSVTVVDDGLMKGGFGTSPFDAEGVRTTRKSSFESGILKTFLHNCYTARRTGVPVTGNAGRSSFRSAVTVSPSNLYLVPGKGTHEDLLSGLDKGFEVCELVGVHAGLNPVTGEISVGAKGRWVERGEPVHPVREVTIAGTMEDLLAGVTAVGSNLRFTPLLGGIGAPSIVVEGLVTGGS